MKERDFGTSWKREKLEECLQIKCKEKSQTFEGNRSYRFKFIFEMKKKYEIKFVYIGES